MNTIDLSPLYRTMVGWDRLASMIDNASRLEGSGGYPPYNIEQTGEDAFAIEIAAAGFSEDNLDIEIREGILTVSGHNNNKEEEKRTFLHRGIAERSFIRRFQLADHVVVGSADLVDGLLRIQLLREVPEAMKPRKIPVSRQQTILTENSSAA